MSETLETLVDKERTDVGYLLGRLFSLLEDIQQKASNGKINSTITDKHFSTVVRYPQKGLQQPMLLVEAHLGKIRRKNNKQLADFFRNELGEVRRKLVDIPKYLSVEQQHRFHLGRSHQRDYSQEYARSKWLKKKEK